MQSEGKGPLEYLVVDPFSLSDTESHIFAPKSLYNFNGSYSSVRAVFQDSVPDDNSFREHRISGIDPKLKKRQHAKPFFTDNVLNILERIHGQTHEQECQEFKIIDYAISYDSSYCNFLGGKENVEDEIISIVAIVSEKFKQKGLCVEVQISYLEGYCDFELDPYTLLPEPGSPTSSLLSEYTEFWIENRKHIKRSVAHLFTANGLHEDFTGRTYLGTLCSMTTGFSVNRLSQYQSLEMKAGLVAHTLGHNAGAPHLTLTPLCLTKPDNYIMHTTINEGENGFHKRSVESMRKVIENRSCLRTRHIPDL